MNAMVTAKIQLNAESHFKSCGCIAKESVDVTSPSIAPARTTLSPKLSGAQAN